MNFILVLDLENLELYGIAVVAALEVIQLMMLRH